MLLLALLSIASVPDLEAENQRLRRYVAALEIYEAAFYSDHRRLENEVDDLRYELAEQVEENRRLNAVALTVEEFRNLKSQVASASSDLTAIQVALFQARQELAQVLAKTSSIQTALGTVTTYRFQCCGSMEPYFDSSDLVFLLWNPSSVVIGDVVGVASCGVTHRIVREDELGFVMKGDNRALENACRFGAGDVAYKVVAVARDVF